MTRETSKSDDDMNNWAALVLLVLLATAVIAPGTVAKYTAELAFHHNRILAEKERKNAAENAAFLPNTAASR